MYVDIIYTFFIIIICISIVVLNFYFQSQIDDLNRQINDLRGQSMKLYSIENDTFSNRKKSLEKCEKNTKSH